MREKERENRKNCVNNRTKVNFFRKSTKSYDTRLFVLDNRFLL